MALTAILQTYGDLSKREDVVLNAIEILTAEENTIQNLLGKTKAINMVHSFLVDTLATAGSLAVEQGTDLTTATLSTPTRLTNIVEEIARTITVTRPEEVAQSYSGENEVSRQTVKALKDWGNGLEFDLVRSTLVSGISGTASKMSGILQAISKSTNYTLQTSGTTFSASILDALMGNNWTNSNGDVATDLFASVAMRRTIDLFTQKTNVVVNANPISAITKTVQTYDTSMGSLFVRKHRYLTISGTDANSRVLGLRPEKLKVAYLDMPFIKDLAESGAYAKKAIYGSCTLEVRNQDSNWFADGYNYTV